LKPPNLLETFFKKLFLRTSALPSDNVYLSIAGAKVALYFYSPNISDTFFTSFFDHKTPYPHTQRVTPKDFLAQFVVFGSPTPPPTSQAANPFILYK